MLRLPLAVLALALFAASALHSGSPTPTPTPTATPTPTPKPTPRPTPTPTLTPVPHQKAPTYKELQERISELEWEAGTRDLEDINRALQAKIEADRKAEEDNDK